MSSIPPAGFSPASAFDIIGHAESEPPVAILADSIDPATGDYRALDESASIADGLVVNLLRIQRGSGAAVLEFGQRFREVRHVTTESPELVESIVREALAPASEAGIVRFDRIAAEADPSDGSQLNAGIEYIDLLAPPRDQNRRFTFTE